MNKKLLACTLCVLSLSCAVPTYSTYTNPAELVLTCGRTLTDDVAKAIVQCIEQREDTEDTTVDENTEQQRRVNLKNSLGETVLGWVISVSRPSKDARALKLVDYLVRKGADLNGLCCSYATPLMLASEQKNYDIICYLYAHGVDISKLNPHQKIDLMIYAVGCHRNDIVKYLIEKGADVNAKDSTGKTALMKAVEQGNFEIVKHLIEKGVDVNAKDSTGKTALMKAVAHQCEDFSTIQYLVEKGVDVNAKDSTGKTALMYAAGIGDLEVVKYLIEKGADVNAKDSTGKTVLMIAIYKCRLTNASKYLEVVKYLIEKGADVNAKDSTGQTALMKAVENRNPEIVKYLIDNGADVNISDNNGQTALTKAAQKQRLDLVECLVQHGANIDVEFSYGSEKLTVLTLAKKFGSSYEKILGYFNSLYEEVDKAINKINNTTDLSDVQTLVTKGINVNTKCKKGQTALMKAAEQGNVEIVKYLIDNGADVNAKDSTGQTALMKAAEQGNFEIVKHLIEKGADVNAKDSTGQTALMKAAEPGNFEIVKHLIEKGADVNAKDSGNHTAAVLAINKRFSCSPINCFYENQLGIKKHTSSDERREKIMSYLEKNGVDTKGKSLNIEDMDEKQVQRLAIKTRYDMTESLLKSEK